MGKTAVAIELSESEGGTWRFGVAAKDGAGVGPTRTDHPAGGGGAGEQRHFELFDENRVSFVSVTQAFNATTSIGRLTLNVRLSFAQFEREVTGERIRDKIAAPKKKGIWMGGVVPLGYRVDNRAFHAVEEHAAFVRDLFRGSGFQPCAGAAAAASQAGLRRLARTSAAHWPTARSFSTSELVS
jgi:Resolvase, N terminal domain